MISDVSDELGIPEGLTAKQAPEERRVSAERTIEATQGIFGLRVAPLSLAGRRSPPLRRWLDKRWERGRMRKGPRQDHFPPLPTAHKF